MDKESRICVIGPGAIGGVVAAILTRESHDTTLVVKHPKLAEKINSKGIEVTGTCGNFTQKVASVALPNELDGTFDYVLIATKADGLVEAARGMLPFLHLNSRVVSMQNGICEEMLADVVGGNRTIGCVVGFGGIMHEPGKVEMTSGGELIIGNWKRERDEELEGLAHILGAICGQSLGEMLANRNNRNLFIEVIREAVAVGNAMEIKIPPGAAGKLDYYKFLAPGILSGIKRHLTIRVIGMKYRKLKSSSLQSLERGRKTEVENYNGYIASKGKELGMATPVNEQLTHMVGEIEQGKRQIDPENFREISFK